MLKSILKAKKTDQERELLAGRCVEKHLESIFSIAQRHLESKGEIMKNIILEVRCGKR